jgi:hypothetical protein
LGLCQVRLPVTVLSGLPSSTSTLATKGRARARPSQLAMACLAAGSGATRLLLEKPFTYPSVRLRENGTTGQGLKTSGLWPVIATWQPASACAVLGVLVIVYMTVVRCQARSGRDRRPGPDPSSRPPSPCWTHWPLRHTVLGAGRHGVSPPPEGSQLSAAMTLKLGPSPSPKASVWSRQEAG